MDVANVRFFQATATVIPTLLIASVITLRFHEPKEEISQTAKITQGAIVIYTVVFSLYGELLSLIRLAIGNSTPGLSFYLVTAIIVGQFLVLGLQVVNRAHSFYQYKASRTGISITFIVVILVVSSLIFVIRT